MEGREEGRGNIGKWLPLTCPQLGTRITTQACALDWEWNRRPFGSQANTQSTEPHQPRLNVHFLDESSWEPGAGVYKSWGLARAKVTSWLVGEQDHDPGVDPWVRLFSLLAHRHVIDCFMEPCPDQLISSPFLLPQNHEKGLAAVLLRVSSHWLQRAAWVRGALARSISGEALNESSTWQGEVLVQDRGPSSVPQRVHARSWVCRSLPHPVSMQGTTVRTGGQLQTSPQGATASCLQQEGKGKSSETCSCLTWKRKWEKEELLLCPQSCRKEPEAEQWVPPRAVGAPTEHICSTKKEDQVAWNHFCSSQTVWRIWGASRSAAPSLCFKPTSLLQGLTPWGSGEWSRSGRHPQVTWCVICGILLCLHSTNCISQNRPKESWSRSISPASWVRPGLEQGLRLGVWRLLFESSPGRDCLFCTPHSFLLWEMQN